MDAFSRALAHVLSEEGGYSNHPDDPGGETMLGVTARTLESARAYLPHLPKRVGDLTKPQAVAIYRRLYWDAIDGDSLPPGIGLALFDAAVNHGPGNAIKFLQRALGVRADGAIGPQTRTALDDAFPEAVLAAMSAERAHTYARLPHFVSFGRGWMARAFRTYREALRQVLHT